MAQWKKSTLTRECGEKVEATLPVIVSASRSTDIPAFYADWFFHRLEKGYSAWKNPFNGKTSYVSYRDTRFIVFWSKNPAPLLPHLHKLKERGIGCYIQYTLNDYITENLERGVPPLKDRVDTFKRLVDTLGAGSVIWRYDPLILTDTITVDHLIDRISRIGQQLGGYTEKLVFSFADISPYRKVRTNLDSAGVRYIEWDDRSMCEFASKLADANRRTGLQLATCGEAIDLSQFGIAHNRCIDDDLIIRLAHDDARLMAALGVTVGRVSADLFGNSILPDNATAIGNGLYAVKRRSNRDQGQRPACGCIVAKDIGQYNTCAHLCEYCYANCSKETALSNMRRHRLNPFNETIL